LNATDRETPGSTGIEDRPGWQIAPSVGEDGGTVSAYAMPAGSFPLRLSLGFSRTANDRGTRAVEPARSPSSEGTGLPHEAPKRHLASAREQAPSVGAGDGINVAASGAVDAPATVPVEAAWTPPSWDDIVREHSTRVYRLAYRLTGNQHDAEDLTQEVFVRVFRSLSSYTPGTFEGWLHRITTNLFLDQARRKQRIRFDGLPDDVGDRLPGREPGPERAWEHNNLDYDVQQALDTLPPDFRAAVVLCDIEGLSYEEIAATLDVKLGTVRSRIHRGRALLRSELAHRRPTAFGDSAATTESEEITR
jgi:RNA polymerase sigma-70 factor (ECF subfamily)